MSDNLTPDDRRKTMRAVKGKGTKPERRLWAMLAGMGIQGWRKNDSSIVGRPDVVFIKQRVAIFIDGCFWHGCPVCRRKMPKTNQNYWERKIQRNIELSELYDSKLQDCGWTVVRIWEHEIAELENLHKKVNNLILNKEISN